MNRIRVLNTTPAARAAGHWLASRLEMGPDREKTLRFGLDIVFSWFTGMALLGLTSAVLGAFWQATAAALSAFLLRVFSAGAHCRTSGRCALLTIAVYSSVGRAAVALADAVSPGVLAAIYALSAACVFARAEPRDPRDTRNLRFRPAAVALLACYLILSLRFGGMSTFLASVSGAVAAGCLWQSWSTTEPGTSVIQLIDRLLDAAGVD